MKPATIRRFRIGDGLVLIAATGLGLGGCRVWLTSPMPNVTTLARWGDIGLLDPAVRLDHGAAAGLYRVGANRPRRRRLWCEPGFLACVAVVLAYAWNTARFVLLYVVAILKLSPARSSSGSASPRWSRMLL